jgi:hypothetical protein
VLNRASRSIDIGNPEEAINLLTKEALPFAFKEHPEVQALLGKAYAALTPPSVLDARACFESAYSLGHRDYAMYIAWLDMERQNRTELMNGIDICGKVLQSDGFEGRTKATFRKRLARYQALRANDLDLTSPDEGRRLRDDSVLSNILAYADALNCNDPALNSYRERADNAISIGLRRHLGQDHIDYFFDLIESILSISVPLDEFVSTIAARTGEVLTRRAVNPRQVVARLHKLIGRVKGMPPGGMSGENQKLVSDVAKMTIQALGERAKP